MQRKHRIPEKKHSAIMLNNGNLKLLAIVTMLIDHIGAAFLVFYMRYGDHYAEYYDIYQIIRGIGRVSFPIFIFLLTEGLYHTRSIIKYLLRLFLFCFLSEIPFDLAFSRKVFDWQSQNVFFTLFIGLAAIALAGWKQRMIYRESDDHSVSGGKRRQRSMATVGAFVYGMDQFLDILIAAVAMYLAHLLKTDYGWAGVLAILVACQLYKHKELQMWGVCSVLFLCAGSFEIYSVFCIPFINRYNGKRGNFPKWLAYFFYPAHLLLLWGVTTFFLRAYS